VAGGGGWEEGLEGVRVGDGRSGMRVVAGDGIAAEGNPEARCGLDSSWLATAARPFFAYDIVERKASTEIGRPPVALQARPRFGLGGSRATNGRIDGD